MKGEAQPREDSDYGGFEHTANDAKESNRKDTTTRAQLRVDLETRTVQRLGARVHHQQFKTTAAAVE